MTFIEALYGSQYDEIAKQGKDGNKGRLNGNLFLSAFLLLILMDVIMLFMFTSGFASFINNSLKDFFGYMDGKTAGKIVAIPLMGTAYLIVSRTVGSEENFKEHVRRFLEPPEDEKKSANKKVLIPFFVLLAILFVGAML